MKNKFLNKIFQNLSPYVPGEQPGDNEFIKLNTNENPFSPPAQVLKAIKNGINESLKKYPDPLATELRKTIGKRYGFPHEWVFAGNGSDEILRLSIIAFSSVGEQVTFLYPSYPLYDVLATISDRKVCKIPLLPDFHMPEDFVSRYTDCLKVVANPDSPSGLFHPVELIEEVVKKAKRVVIIDEAYADFAEKNCLHLAKKYGNVLITRSFSKSFSLAGIRLGYCFGNPDLISALFAIKDSYNLNSLSQIAGIAAMNNYHLVQKNCIRIIKNRQFLKKQLETIGFYVFPSSANFLFVRPPDGAAEQIYQYLKANKILVRYFNIQDLKDYLRITVGSRNQIYTLLKAVKKYYGYQ
ncbi:MAG TPA: histidinol-phosphate transaminase [bacterium]|nr:histidinol-phosphate transaminase [bacterium]